MDAPESERATETYTVTVTLPASVGIDAVLEAIAAIDDGLTVRDLRSGGRRTVRVDTGELTPIQRETLVRAVAAGYYTVPRRVSLSALSKRFDVSQSAVSQRLRTAEATLVRAVVRAMAPDAVVDDE